VTVLEASGVETLYGPGCQQCLDATGDSTGTNQCPHCGSVVACAEADLTVESGEVLGIVGESGSGKSSLAEVLALERNPDATTDGEVTYAGHEGNLLDIDYQTRHKLRTDDIALVHQHIRDGLDLEFTGGGNVAEKLLSSGWRSY
jgi:putative phosphonate transport system ATP-binding protein